MKRRLAGLPAMCRKRAAPALALALAAALVAAASLWYMVRVGSDRSHPARVETSQSACPTPPPGYSPCDPMPTNTGFQTGDVG